MKIKLDLDKLLGYRLVIQKSDSNSQLGPKIGSKGGVIGLKQGNKPVQTN